MRRAVPGDAELFPRPSRRLQRWCVAFILVRSVPCAQSVSEIMDDDEEDSEMDRAAPSSSSPEGPQTSEAASVTIAPSDGPSPTTKKSKPRLDTPSA